MYFCAWRTTNHSHQSLRLLSHEPQIMQRFCHKVPIPNTKNFSWILVNKFKSYLKLVIKFSLKQINFKSIPRLGSQIAGKHFVTWIPRCPATWFSGFVMGTARLSLFYLMNLFQPTAIRRFDVQNLQTLGRWDRQRVDGCRRSVPLHWSSLTQ